MAAQALQGVVLAEAQVEEGVAGNRLDQGLDHPAHARRHPASEDAEGHLAAAERLDAEG